MMDRDCDTLLNIGKVNNKFIYQFKNIKVITAKPPEDIFKRCGYDRRESKDAPIDSAVRDRIMGLVKRF